MGIGDPHGAGDAHDDGLSYKAAFYLPATTVLIGGNGSDVRAIDVGGRYKAALMNRRNSLYLQNGVPLPGLVS
jgi:hypothetical protein